MTLTPRSKITVRWTTAPSDMGYGGTATNWQTMKGETMGLRRATEFAHDLSRRIGEGCYRLIAYSYRGQPIEIGAIHDALAQFEYDRAAR